MAKDEVKFTEMKHGDKEDYELLANFEDKYKLMSKYFLQYLFL